MVKSSQFFHCGSFLLSNRVQSKELTLKDIFLGKTFLVDFQNVNSHLANRLLKLNSLLLWEFDFLLKALIYFDKVHVVICSNNNLLLELLVQFFLLLFIMNQVLHELHLIWNYWAELSWKFLFVWRGLVWLLHSLLKFSLGAERLNWLKMLLALVSFNWRAGFLGTPETQASLLIVGYNADLRWTAFALFKASIFWPRSAPFPRRKFVFLNLQHLCLIFREVSVFWIWNWKVFFHVTATKVEML